MSSLHSCLGTQVGDRDLLEGISWRLMPGHRVGLVGANGAGKSTLLRCLTGVRQVGCEPCRTYMGGGRERTARRTAIQLGEQVIWIPVPRSTVRHFAMLGDVRRTACAVHTNVLPR